MFIVFGASYHAFSSLNQQVLTQRRLENVFVWFQNETAALRKPLTLGNETFNDSNMFRFYLIAQVNEYTCALKYMYTT